jgi:hypothetical protein
MPASLYGAGNYGAGLYSADPLQEAAVTWGVKVALQANASFGVLVSAAVTWSVQLSMEASPVGLALGSVTWGVPASLDVTLSTVVVFAAMAWVIGAQFTAENVYGGLYWSDQPDSDQDWTPVAVSDTIWTPISAPQV